MSVPPPRVVPPSAERSGFVAGGPAGAVALKPDRPGTTSLAVIANGMREYLTVTVPPAAAPGRVDCR